MFLNRMNKDKGRVPTVLQMEAVECGAASLAMILAYYGAYVPLEKLRVECGISRDGSKASNLLKAARHYGLEAKGFRKEPTHIDNKDLPAIIHWNFNHFLVLEKIHGDYVYLNDPSSGPKRVTNQEFNTSFTGIILQFTQGDTFKSLGHPPSVLKMLKPRLQGSYKEVLFLFLIGVSLTFPGLIIPIFSKVFIDDVILSNRQDWLIPLLIGMLLTALLRSSLTWMREYYLLRFETKLSVQNASKYLWHVLHLPVVFFTQRYAGDISSRMKNNDHIATMLAGRVATTLLSALMVVFYLVLMVYYNLTLTLIALGAALLNIGLMRYISRVRKNTTGKYLKDFGKLYGTSISGIKMIETLKATGAESDFFEKWSGYQAKALNGEQALGSTKNILLIIPNLLSKLSMNLILIIGGLEIIRGNMTVGMLVAFQSLMMSFMEPVVDLVNTGDEFQQLFGDMSRVDDVVHYPIDCNFVERGTGDQKKLSKLVGRISVDNISFGYNPLDPPLIENFSVEISPGSRVALVGGSGSGKSTIARIIAGLYEPWSGEIRFDNQPRKLWSREVLVGSLAVVDQEVSMFNDTIFDNVTMWNKTILESDVIKACKDACIHDDVTMKTGGYQYIAEEEGNNFSGGQRQRLEIARTLAINPSILILDEATSALDPKTEKLIDENIRKRGCSCLIVAHRLSTIKDCDEIIVLDKGKIVERGIHQDLMALKGHYAALVGSH
jgi:NHLM bacteriocin system ABC transporter peptidase/ATP-binding protein